MIKEALEFLGAAFVKGDRVSKFDLPDGSTRIYGPNGACIETIEGHPSRRVECKSLGDFISTFENAKADLDADSEHDGVVSSISVGESGVEAYLRGGLNQYAIVFDFEFTRPATTLGVFTNETELDHKQLLKMLRTSLRGSINSSVIPQFAKVAFSGSTSGVSQVERGRESFGKSVENAVANAIDLPEAIACRCDLFIGVPEAVSFELCVYVDAEAQRFKVWIDSQVWATECERVRRLVVAKIAEKAGCPILSGEITETSILKAPLFN